MAHVRRDSRVHPRSPLRLPVRATDPSRRVTGAIGFEAIEVTGGGAFLPSDLLLELGDLLLLEFSLPGGRSVLAQARVARVSRGNGTDPSGIGVEFVEIAPDDKAALEQLVP